MIEGMTGFGRAEGGLDGWTWAVEARSVNGRGLEVRFRGPPGFEGLERAAREAAQARFARGQITVNIQAKRVEGGGLLAVNIAQLERYLAAGTPYVATAMVERARLDGLLALRGVIDAGEDEPAETRAAVEAWIAADIALAFDDLKAARAGEGAALAQVLGRLVDEIKAMVAAAGGEAAGQSAALKDKLVRRMAELVDTAGFEDRLAQEAAALALRADVREELDRLDSHVVAARALLAGEGAAGRKLDFLTQEFMREANTLCSKSSSSALTAVGLDLKAAIDQFREQVQNVQ